MKLLTVMAFVIGMFAFAGCFEEEGYGYAPPVYERNYYVHDYDYHHDHDFEHHDFDGRNRERHEHEEHEHDRH